MRASTSGRVVLISSAAQRCTDARSASPRNSACQAIVSISAGSRPATAAPVAIRSSAQSSAPGVNRPSSITPSASSPASASTRGPRVATKIGTGKPGSKSRLHVAQRERRAVVADRLARQQPSYDIDRLSQPRDDPGLLDAEPGQHARPVAGAEAECEAPAADLGEQPGAARDLHRMARIRIRHGEAEADPLGRLGAQREQREGVAVERLVGDMEVVVAELLGQPRELHHSPVGHAGDEGDADAHHATR